MRHSGNPSSGEERQHIPALDGVRGLAILLVFIHHATVMRGATRFDEAFLFTAHFGWIGVNLFFVLSGFLITGILLDARRAGHYFRNFYARRILRIFPLYYAALLCTLLLLPLIPVARDISNDGAVHGGTLWYFLYASNFYIAWLGHFPVNLMDVSWTLAIEEQFYLVWPLVVFLLPRTAVMRVGALMFVGSLLFRLGMTFAAHASMSTVEVLTPSQLDGLGLGAFLAAASRGPRGLEPLAPWARPAMWLSLVLAIATALPDLNLSEMPAPRRAVGVSPHFLTFGLSCTSVLFASLIVRAVTAPQTTLVTRLLSSGPLRVLGKYSYCMYLVHMPVILLVQDFVFGPPDKGHARFHFVPVLGSQFAGQLLFYALTLAIVLVLTKLSWVAFEAPLLRFKRYFPSAPAKKVPPEVSRLVHAD
jgi:peptidoglycan/LPS O-acetylase OafA/YrhL